MILSDTDIENALNSGHMKLGPLAPDAIQPSSVDIRLANGFRVYDWHAGEVLDPAEPQTDLMHLVEVPENQSFILPSGGFVLGTTIEEISLPADLTASLEGKSSLARIGLVIHATAGYIDPGFCGQITLELFNFASLPIRLRPGMPIGQLTFLKMTSPSSRPYGHSSRRSKYQGQRGPTASEAWQNFLPYEAPENS